MSIRTTVTLDDDVLERAREYCRKRGISFRQGLNELVRSGIRSASSVHPRELFRVEPVRGTGYNPSLNYDCAADLLEQIEGPWHR